MNISTDSLSVQTGQQPVLFRILFCVEEKPEKVRPGGQVQSEDHIRRSGKVRPKGQVRRSSLIKGSGQIVRLGQIRRSFQKVFDRVSD